MANDFLSLSSDMEQITMEGHNPVLPEDIIRNILKRLPVKSLIRFRCVCKHWENLLRTQSFITEHLDHSRNENSSILLQWDAKCDPSHLHMLNHKMQVLQVQSSPFMDSLSSTKIVGCSNGLLCVRIDGDATLLPSLLVWNPATREVLEVPRPINFDDEDDFCELGFGFSPIVNDYKIVISNAMYVAGEDNLLEVYSLSTGSWKEIETEELGGMSVNPFPVTVNGAMFWYVNWVSGDDDGDIVSDWMIVSFDIATEVFELISLPFDLKSPGGFLSVYENKLAMLSSTVIGNHESSRTDLLVLEEGEGASRERWSWTKMYSISTSPSMYPRGIWLDGIVYINSIFPQYGEPESEGEDGILDVLYRLNLSTNELVNFTSHRRGHRLSVTFGYAESLMPVDNIHL